MTKHSCLKFIALLLIIAGCEEYKYSIEMKSCDEGVERKLTCSDNLSEDKKATIVKLYEKQIDTNTFWGKFDTNLPNDIGGAGFYTTLSTNMGQVTIYSERFRGNDNLNYTLEQAQLFVDQLVDFLIGWLEHELGDEPNFINLKVFCNENLRNDLKNMAIYFWLSNVLTEYKSTESEEMIIRMMHYFIERGYSGPKQMYVTSFGSDEEQILRILRQLIADKMGYSSPEIVSERLEFLSDTEHAEESMGRYVCTTDFFIKAWEAKKLQENDPNAEQPQINVGEFIMQDIDLEFDFFSLETSNVEVKLACKSEPFYTNGQWDEHENQVVWLSKIAEDMKLPTFFYASWSEPNDKYQQEHFGRIVLSNEDLAQYCAWKENLDEEEGKEWDSFISSLNQGEDLEGRLNAFRFSSDQQEELDTKENDLAKRPRDLILAGLKSETEKKENILTPKDEE